MIPDTVSTSLNDLYTQRLHAHTDISEHLPRLKAFAELTQARNIVELGVRQGNSTLAFLIALRITGSHLYSVDIDPIEGELKQFVGRIGQWDFRQQDDLPYPPFFPDQADIIFIDTSHELEQTRKEIAAYTPHLAPKGVMLFHDTDMKANPHFGVMPAIVEFCYQHPSEWQTHFWSNNNGLGVLFRAVDSDLIHGLISTIDLTV
jgi:predicted O-methyltransferase YrrM